jgi:anti-anti-sigma factor
VASITADRPERLIFDLSGLRFLDSAGIAVLIGAAAMVNAVHLRDPSPIVRRVVEVTGLSDVLLIES